MRRYGLQASPERTKVWTEPPPKHSSQHHHQQSQQRKKVPVVYYLCKNRHLEHPHFVEVPLASPEGLYLRDVIDRLNALRGKGMAAMYSWSCKRSYKNGFVWHDLAEDDLILPAQGNEYVLKGSELLNQSPPDRHHNGSSNQKIQNSKYPQKEDSVPCKAEEARSSSSSVTIKEVKQNSPSPPPQQPQPPPLSPPATTEEDELSPTSRQSSSSGNLSPETGVRTPALSATGSRSSIEYGVSKLVGAQDASTQTDDGRLRKASGTDTCITGVSTDDGNQDSEFNEGLSDGMQRSKGVNEIVRGARSPTPISSSTSCGKISTLETLIREEASKRNSFRIVEEEEIYVPNKAKMKATNALLHLLTCGSIVVKDHYSFGLVPTYKPRFTNMNLRSGILSSSVLDETNCLSESQRDMGLRLKKEYRSGNIVEPTNYKDKAGEVLPAGDGSSSFDVNRSCEQPDSRKEKESKCLPRSIIVASSGSFRNDKNGNMPMSDNSCKSSPLSSSRVGSRKIFDSSSVNVSPVRFESFREEKDNMIKIEERLTSGARIVIQARPLSTNNGDISD